MLEEQNPSVPLRPQTKHRLLARGLMKRRISRPLMLILGYSTVLASSSTLSTSFRNYKLVSFEAFSVTGQEIDKTSHIQQPRVVIENGGLFRIQRYPNETRNATLHHSKNALI